jgi:hypothetical protein
MRPLNLLAAAIGWFSLLATAFLCALLAAEWLAFAVRRARRACRRRQDLRERRRHMREHREEYFPTVDALIVATGGRPPAERA